MVDSCASCSNLDAFIPEIFTEIVFLKLIPAIIHCCSSRWVSVILNNVAVYTLLRLGLMEIKLQFVEIHIRDNDQKGNQYMEILKMTIAKPPRAKFLLSYIVVDCVKMKTLHAIGWQNM